MPGQEFKNLSHCDHLHLQVTNDFTNLRQLLVCTPGPSCCQSGYRADYRELPRPAKVSQQAQMHNSSLTLLTSTLLALRSQRGGEATVAAADLAGRLPIAQTDRHATGWCAKSRSRRPSGCEVEAWPSALAQPALCLPSITHALCARLYLIFGGPLF